MNNGGFSLRDLIKPGDGAENAIRREVELRHGREAFKAKSNWFYTGEAGMLLLNGQMFPGEVLPEQYRHLVGEPANCHANAVAACREDPTLRFFTGYYTVGRDVTQHSWCIDPLGRLVELTYPTFGVTPGSRIADEDGRPSSVGWMPPEFWRYYGLEFKVPFMDALWAKHGEIWYPMMDPDMPWHSDLMSHIYTPDGFTV